MLNTKKSPLYQYNHSMFKEKPCFRNNKYILGKKQNFFVVINKNYYKNNPCKWLSITIEMDSLSLQELKEMTARGEHKRSPSIELCRSLAMKSTSGFSSSSAPREAWPVAVLEDSSPRMLSSLGKKNVIIYSWIILL